jgi:hypothetical protein
VVSWYLIGVGLFKVCQTFIDPYLLAGSILFYQTLLVSTCLFGKRIKNHQPKAGLDQDDKVETTVDLCLICWLV